MNNRNIQRNITSGNRSLLYQVAVNTTYTDVGSADIASLHGCNLVGQCRSNCRGANICHPCTLYCNIPVAEAI